MKASPGQVRVLRALGIIAVVHAVLLFSIFFREITDDWPDWMFRLWTALATLWFFWPLILALHPAQSARRVLVPLAISAPFVFCWFRIYADTYAPSAFGLPDDSVRFTPSGLFQYGTCFARGWFDGRKVSKSGELSLEAYGPPMGTATPGTPKFSVETLKQSGIHIRYVASDVVSSEILAHARGYNLAMMPEIRRRLPAVVKATEDEDTRLDRLLKDGEKAGRAEAQSDFHSGHFGIVLDDPSRIDDVAFENWVREKYGISVKRVNPRADQTNENYWFGYVSGYNRVSDKELRHRFGRAALEEIWQKWVEIPQTGSNPK